MCEARYAMVRSPKMLHAIHQLVDSDRVLLILPRCFDILLIPFQIDAAVWLEHTIRFGSGSGMTAAAAALLVPSKII